MPTLYELGQFTPSRRATNNNKLTGILWVSSFSLCPKLSAKLPQLYKLNTDIMLGCVCSTQVSSANPPPPPLTPQRKKRHLFYSAAPPSVSKVP